MKLAQSLRKEGVKTHIEFGSKGMKGHMKKAGKLDVNFVIIIGEDEINRGVVILKDFNNRTQEEIKISEVSEIVGKLKK